MCKEIPMHKFFCNYNYLTERYELSNYRGSIFNNKILVQAENTLLPEIKKNIQSLYELIVKAKELTTDENQMTKLDETELMISNLFYNLFASPLELPESNENNDLKNLYQNAIALTSELEKEINIPEYNRTISLIKNNLQDNYNSLSLS